MDTMLPTKDELLEYYYLGVPEIREQAVWRTIGRENKLVTAESVRAADRKAARIAEIEEVKVNERFGNRGASQRTSIPETLVPVDLTFVAVISPNDFWLTPDVNWKGKTPYTKTFEDVRLRCRLVAPKIPDFAASDFSEALANLDWFMGASATPGNTRQSIVEAGAIKLRHVLFERIEGEPVDSEVKAMEDWPCSTEEARKARDAIKRTHRVLPLKAFDMAGNLLPPTKYSQALKGAVVRVSVKLTRWKFRPQGDDPRGRDVYTADIDNIRVLVPPKPRTRQIIPRTDPGPSRSPKKKARTLGRRD
ncbi:hypothetical protein DFH08DRAFT_873609 [Mycena albidolilacea]|uniref:Uncharacterized protein n=1 Tax=Mycena albidolilacea TaxID=1033008 RepID=A0AAD7EP64_9AGAR|nr:hypothetical protein DFH08DRAFT_873609 [Mycena albidolilacea]